MRQVLIAVAIVIFIGVCVTSCALVRAHRQIESIDPRIPSVEELLVAPSSSRRPISLHYVNTASQGMGHAAYLLEWPGGELFMIDAGMDREGAEAFGRPIELLYGGDPIVHHGNVAELMGRDLQRLRAVAFTHLHSDHTDGLIPVCAALEHDIPVFQTSFQADLLNHTTRPGNDHLDAASCVGRQIFEGPGPHPVPGFPGLSMLAVGGHTPGSTVFVAHLPGRTWVFAGDIQNTKADLLANRGKGWVYSTLIVPEATERLERLRGWLSELDGREGVGVIVSHDVDAAIADGVSAWGADPRARAAPQP